MNTHNEDLFDVISDGLVVCHLLNKGWSDAIDMNKIRKGTTLNTFVIANNLDIFLTACKSNNRLKVIGIGTSDFIDKKPNLMLVIVS